MNVLRKIIYNLKTLFLPCPENDYKIKFLYKNYFALCVITLICLKLFIIPVFVVFPQNIFFADISKIALINIINQEREKNNLGLLESNSVLDKAAEYKARDMLEHNYFEHNSPSGITPWHWFEKVNYNYAFAGENLAIGFLESEEVYSAWMNSPSHKANLMNSDYQEIGIAVIDGNFDGGQTSIIVQTFGAPQTSADNGILRLLPQNDRNELSQNDGEELAQNDEEKTPATPPSAEDKTEERKTAQVPQVQGIQSFTQISSFEEQKQEKNTIKFSIWKFMVMGYYDFVQKLILYLLLFSGLLISLIFSFKTTALDKHLISKTIVFMLILSVFYLIDKQSILQIIPHELII